MDETPLRDLLERATVPEPPIGPVAQNALRAGLTLRRRRRTRYAAAGAATIVVACAAALAVTGTTGRQAAAPARNAATIYVVSQTGTEIMVTPVPTATDKPGEPVRIGPQGPYVGDILTALSSDGKTIWVSNGSVVWPFSTATDTAGKQIAIPNRYGNAFQLLASPNGKTVYVLAMRGAFGTVMPISTATDRLGKPIYQGLGFLDMAITPDGKTLYILGPGYLSSRLIPVATSSNEPGEPISLGIGASAIFVPPDGRTAYAIGNLGPGAQTPEIEPISTVTNKPGSPIGFAAAGGIFGIAMAPDEHVIYVAVRFNARTYGAIPFFTASNTLGKVIALPAGMAGQGMLAVAPDGRAIYVADIPPQSSRRVTEQTVKKGYCPDAVMPIMTATGTVGNAFHTCFPASVVFTPDGRTAYISSAGGAPSGQSIVMSAATATGHRGKSFIIKGQAVAMVMTP
jgi:DNA-binding beta-propeller fold protein YncE